MLKCRKFLSFFNIYILTLNETRVIVKVYALTIRESGMRQKGLSRRERVHFDFFNSHNLFWGLFCL